MTETCRIDRLHEMQTMLGRGRIVYRSELMEKFGISRATLNRDVAELRNRYQMPIDCNTAYGGYRLAAEEKAGGQFELPSLTYRPAVA